MIFSGIKKIFKINLNKKTIIIWPKNELSVFDFADDDS